MEDLTKKQAEFVKEYLDTGNGVQSALKAYDTEDYSTAGNIASENLKKPKILEYLESVADKVASNMYHLALNAESEQVQLGAGKDILDRAGYKPVDKSELSNPDGNLKTIIINKHASTDRPTTEAN